MNGIDSRNLRVIRPPNLGWLEKKLSDHEMHYLWECIDNRGKSHKKNLVGNIHESNVLVDEGEWFYDHTLLPLCHQYECQFQPMKTVKHGLVDFWVNYQKQNEFNPIHDHGGVYSFVIWMKIPTRHFVQNQNPISFNSKSHKISSFEFLYTNILGSTQSFPYPMNPELEGVMAFFPSKLLHQVYPFFNCDEDRISISGNIE